MTEIEKYTREVGHVMDLARREAFARAGFFGAVSISFGEEWKGRCFYFVPLAISRRLFSFSTTLRP